MPRRSDAKQHMVSAARRLFTENGYAGTAFSDVLEASSSPRGSIYFHFPGGKEQLAQEVILEHIAAITIRINRAAIGAATPAEFITNFMSTAKIDLEKAGLLEGCAVAPVVMERSATSDNLRNLAKSAFNDMIGAFAARFRDLGLSVEEAHSMAVSCETVLQGCLVVARATGDAACFDGAARMLTAGLQTV